VVQTDDGKPGALATFPYDRETVEKFRDTFPRARWRDDLKSWFVPGATAHRRIERWFAREWPAATGLADEKGRDAYAFEPIASPYLEAGEDLRIRTPYSLIVVEEMRQIPWAWWDQEGRLWRVPFRSYEALRQRWPAVEAAARRNEPEERARRRQERAGTQEHLGALRATAERRKRRIAVPLDALPPLSLPVATERSGIVVIEDVTGELVEREAVDTVDAELGKANRDLVWATWRRPSLAELVSAWPARRDPSDEERSRGWWQPTRADLREARRLRRSQERAAERRRS
jgi:hypothetical protein